MENIRHNLVSIIPNRNIRINNVINNRVERIETYKILFSTILYIYIIPLIIFFLIKSNLNITQYFFPHINHNKNIPINNQFRNLDNHIIINYDKSELSGYEGIQKIINMILERFNKNLLNDSTEKNHPIANKTLYQINSEEFFDKQLTKKSYKGVWEYDSYEKENSEINQTRNWLDLYRKIFYMNSNKKKFTLGKETSGTAKIQFKKEYRRFQINSTNEIFSVNLLILEGKYMDNWMRLSSSTRFSNLKKYINEQTKKFYISGEFMSFMTMGQIYQSLFNNVKETCQSLIEMEFPLTQNSIYTLIGNTTYPTKNFYIHNNNFTMVISSSCGFRLKINASTYNIKDEITSSETQKELNKYLWMNVIISIIYFFAYICTYHGLNKHQDTISAFSVLCLSQNMSWHSYRSLSDINLALNFPQFFGPFMLISIFPLLNFFIFDLKLLMIYWKINKRILSNRQFVILRLKFFLIFYFFLFCSFVFTMSFYFEKFFIAILAVLLWTPQIIHNAQKFNKFNYPLIFILAITLDRMIVPFYFRGNDKNFLNIKTDKFFVIYIAGYIFATIFIIYLQIFFGPRFMLSKRYQKVEIDFHRTKAEILKEKPNLSEEECIICLCPLFNDNEANTNTLSFNNNENNENNNSDIKTGSESISNNYEIINENQSNQSNQGQMELNNQKNILEIAKKKKIKSAKKMKLFKDKINPIIIDGYYLDQKPKYRNNRKFNICFYKQIFLLLRVILWDNLFFFYKYEKNKNIKKYMLIKCGHAFHTKCLEKWFEMKKECPSCRASMQDYI